MPMMLLLDHIFLRRLACTQRGFLLQQNLLFAQVHFITGYREYSKCVVY